MELVYLRAADQDLDRLFSFLIDHEASLETAENAIDTIEQGAALLLDNPELGTKLDNDTERRELVLPFGKGSYVIRYFVDCTLQQILILRVWHSREDRD